MSVARWVLTIFSIYNINFVRYFFFFGGGEPLSLSLSSSRGEELVVCM